MVKREKANYMIQSVSHALDVLEELSGVELEIGVTELSKRLKLHKNNVFRLLATLELRGYAEQNRDSEDYRLGVKALQLGQSYLTQNNLVSRAVPVLKSLVEATGETCSVAILQNGQVQFPVSIESKRPVRVSGRVAVSFGAKSNAAGRLLTANLSDSMLSEVLATNTPQDAAIKNQLTELRNSGQIVDKGVIESDVFSICKIIRGSKNEVVGAIELLVPQYRAKVEALLPLIDQAASKLSAALGAGNVKVGLGAALEKEVTSAPAQAMSK